MCDLPIPGRVHFIVSGNEYDTISRLHYFKVRTSGVISDRSILFSFLRVANLSLAIISCKSHVIGRFYVTSFERSLHLVASSFSYSKKSKSCSFNRHSWAANTFYGNNFFDYILAAQISYIMYRSLNFKNRYFSYVCFALYVISYLMTV